MTTLTWTDPQSWQPVVLGRRGAAAAGVADGRPDFLDQVSSQLLPVQTISGMAVSDAGQRRAALPPVSLTATVPEEGEYVLAVRYPSGAIRFIAPDGPTTPALARSVRGRGRASREHAGPRQLAFRAPPPLSGTAAARRGFVDETVGAVEAVLLKIVTPIMAKAVDAAEAQIWKLLGRQPGLRQVTHAGLAAGDLRMQEGPIARGPNGRALLMLHGTFSATAPAFAGLARNGAMNQLTAIYGDAIYGLDHYSVSLDTVANAAELLDALPDVPITFDVITHSRGGLVLRQIVERSEQFGNRAGRFRLGKAVLVACPNGGTPLARPQRIGESAQFIANLAALGNIDLGMIAHWVGWFAKVAIASAPGLSAMNPDGDEIAALQSQPGPEADNYWALVSNYVPDERLWMRLLDLGADMYFQEPNDLVVPTGGGWRIDRLLDAISPAQVGCIGEGGNITAGSAPVSHVGFFERVETADFLTRVLSGESSGLAPMDFHRALPFGRPRRRADSIVEPSRSPAVVEARGRTTERQDVDAYEPADEPSPTKLHKAARTLPELSPDLPHVFELLVVQSDGLELRSRSSRRRESFESIAHKIESVPILLATYRGARVSVPFRLRDEPEPTMSSKPDGGKRNATGAPTDINLQDASRKAATAYESGRVVQQQRRWQALIAMHRRLRAYVDGKESQIPPDSELHQFGDTLFETLLPGKVRRLFDVARVSEGKRLSVVFTSMIDWVSDLPWEFARDPDRETFLATEDAHFLRNVLTPSPIERFTMRSASSIKILIAIATPHGLTLPGATIELNHIETTLAAAKHQGRVNIEVLLDATPSELHRRLVVGGHDILHFIGHGFYSTETSGLVLDDGSGGQRMLSERSLREVLGHRQLQLAFLNACDTGTGVSGDDRAYSTGGVAQSLFGLGIPVVVANQLKVRDAAAADFAAQFYNYLAHGKTIAEATRESRIAASYARGSESIDWAIPVVYARTADGRLVDP